MKLKLCLMGLLCLNFSANAQNKPGSSALTIGDQVPELVLNKTINSPEKVIRLSDYRGKLILVDFWETHCGNCIAEIHGLDSLQKKFHKNIQIILVDSYQGDTETAMKLFLARQKEWSGFNITLPIAYQDTTISKYIWYRSIPTCAWISPDGHLLAVTDDDQVTTENILKALDGQSATLTSKERYATDLKPKS